MPHAAPRVHHVWVPSTPAESEHGAVCQGAELFPRGDGGAQSCRPTQLTNAPSQLTQMPPATLLDRRSGAAARVAEGGDRGWRGRAGHLLRAPGQPVADRALAGGARRPGTPARRAAGGGACLPPAPPRWDRHLPLFTSTHDETPTPAITPPAVVWRRTIRWASATSRCWSRSAARFPPRTLWSRRSPRCSRAWATPWGGR